MSTPPKPDRPAAAAAKASNLDPAARDRALQLSLWEAGLWGLMVGCGETYFLATAVALGASPLQLALVVTLPLFLGAAGPLAAIRLLGWLPVRRPAVVTIAVLQAINLLVMAWAEVAAVSTPWSLIGSASLHQVCAMGAGTLWSSWYGDLVPENIRGRYFARRNRGSQLALFAGLALSGGWLQWSAGAGGGPLDHSAAGLGFGAIFAVAALARLASAALLSRSPEPRFGGLASLGQSARFLGTERGRNATRVLVVGGVVQLTTYIASPFFVPFMLEELSFSYLQYMAATAAVVAAKLWSLPAWGHQIDAHGAGTVFRTAVLMVSLVPLPWLFIHGLGGVLLAQAFSGLSWACYEVAFFTLLVESTYRRTRPYVFATQNLFNGTAQLLGSLIGAFLLGQLGLSFRAVFGVSTAARVLVSTVQRRWIPRPTERPPEARSHRLILRAIGFRPHAGLALRPASLDESDGDGGAGDEHRPAAM